MVGSVLIWILGLFFFIPSLFQLTACRLTEGAVVFNGLSVYGSKSVLELNKHADGKCELVQLKLDKISSGYPFLNSSMYGVPSGERTLPGERLTTCSPLTLTTTERRVSSILVGFTTPKEMVSAADETILLDR